MGEIDEGERCGEGDVLRYSDADAVEDGGPPRRVTRGGGDLLLVSEQGVKVLESGEGEGVGHHERSSPAPPSPQQQESSSAATMMDDKVTAVEAIITKWDPEASSFAKITSLFYEDRAEARRFLLAVSDLHRAFVGSDIHHRRESLPVRLREAQPIPDPEAGLGVTRLQNPNMARCIQGGREDALPRRADTLGPHLCRLGCHPVGMLRGHRYVFDL